MMPKFVHCKSCGMPMMKPEEHGNSDINNDWCKYCCNQDGTHKSYEEILENMVKFMMSEEGVQMSGLKFDSIEEAKEVAKKYLSSMPAWSEKKD